MATAAAWQPGDVETEEEKRRRLGATNPADVDPSRPAPRFPWEGDQGYRPQVLPSPVSQTQFPAEFPTQQLPPMQQGPAWESPNLRTPQFSNSIPSPMESAVGNARDRIAIPAPVPSPAKQAYDAQGAQYAADTRPIWEGWQKAAGRPSGSTLTPSGVNAYTDSVLAKHDPYAVQHASQPEMNIPAWTPEPTYAGSTPESQALAMANARDRASIRALGGDPSFSSFSENAIDSRPEMPTGYGDDAMPMAGERGGRVRSTTEMLGRQVNPAFAEHMARVDRMRGVGQGASYEDRRAAQTRNAEDRVAWRREGLTPTQNQVARDMRAGKPLTVTQAIAGGMTNPVALRAVADAQQSRDTLEGIKDTNVSRERGGENVANIGAKASMYSADKQYAGTEKEWDTRGKMASDSISSAEKMQGDKIAADLETQKREITAAEAAQGRQLTAQEKVELLRQKGHTAATRAQIEMSNKAIDAKNWESRRDYLVGRRKEVDRLAKEGFTQDQIDQQMVEYDGTFKPQVISWNLPIDVEPAAAPPSAAAPAAGSDVIDLGGGKYWNKKTRRVQGWK
jgi:hypothetical protein